MQIQSEGLFSNLDLSTVTLISERRGATVYKVQRDSELLLLKMCRRGFISPPDSHDANLVFDNEVSVLSTLRLAKGPKLIDVGESDGNRWMLTTWVEGTDSWRLCESARASMTTGEFQRWFLHHAQALCKALAEIHGAGYVHGDLHPDHFICGESGRVNLIDFGLSKRPHTSEFACEGGNLAYWSPELAQQRLAKSSGQVIDWQSEVYSLASLLYVLYSRSLPLDYGSGDLLALGTDERLQVIANKDARRFEEVGAQFPFLEDILLAALKRDRQTRLPDLQALQFELQRGL